MTLKTEQYIAALGREIENFNPPAEPANLYAPIKYQLEAGGKRIRPLLTLVACDMFGGDIQKAISPALGLEIFHNFTLLHDDLMDRADLRRNRATVHKVWGDNGAILSGDAMQIIAYQMIGAVEPQYLDRVLKNFSNTALQICEGQQYDMDFETRNDVSEQEYITMIRLKTAVLLGCALKIGAIVAGAKDSDAEKMYQYGVNIGIAFQLQDDYLDVYGDTATFGKKIGGDIVNNKKTYMLISALNLAQGGDKAELTELITTPQTNPTQKVAQVTALYTKLGIDKLVKDKMATYYNAALKDIEGLSNTTELISIANELMNREV